MLAVVENAAYAVDDFDIVCRFLLVVLHLHRYYSTKFVVQVVVVSLSEMSSNDLLGDDDEFGCFCGGFDEGSVVVAEK